MRTEIGPDEAEAEGFGGTKVEAENEVWPDFHPSDTKPSPGAPDLSIPGTCFTKQTGDMVYTMAENSWLSQLWLDA
ncbi:MAG: hypothetical protein WBC92_10690 [Terracidiphilus sp.]